jgi:hypothetical protein
MNSDSAAGRAGRRATDRSEATPAPDMQPEDAGTPASGNTGRGTAAQPAMREQDKTPAESGSRRPGSRR